MMPLPARQYAHIAAGTTAWCRPKTLTSATNTRELLAALQGWFLSYMASKAMPMWIEALKRAAGKYESSGAAVLARQIEEGKGEAAAAAATAAKVPGKATVLATETAGARGQASSDIPTEDVEAAAIAAATPAKADCTDAALPEDWRDVHDPVSNRHHYLNLKTGESTLKRPGTPSPLQASGIAVDRAVRPSTPVARPTLPRHAAARGAAKKTAAQKAHVISDSLPTPTPMPTATATPATPAPAAAPTPHNSAADFPDELHMHWSPDADTISSTRSAYGTLAWSRGSPFYVAW